MGLAGPRFLLAGCGFSACYNPRMNSTIPIRSVSQHKLTGIALRLTLPCGHEVSIPKEGDGLAARLPSSWFAETPGRSLARFASLGLTGRQKQRRGSGESQIDGRQPVLGGQRLQAIGLSPSDSGPPFQSSIVVQ